MSQFLGSWKLSESEKFDSFLSEMGVRSGNRAGWVTGVGRFCRADVSASGALGVNTRAFTEENEQLLCPTQSIPGAPSRDFVLRKFAQTATPTVNISQDGDKWKLETVTTMKTSVIEFKMGEEFLEKRLDGHEVRSIMNMEGDKMVQKQFPDEAKKVKEVLITRWVEGNQLIVTAECNKVVSTRKYAKQ